MLYPSLGPFVAFTIGLTWGIAAGSTARCASSRITQSGRNRCPRPMRSSRVLRIARREGSDARQLDG